MAFVCVLLKEPPKEDLTVSEKFQLVLDVAQKAQVQRGSSNDPTAARNKTNSLMRCFLNLFQNLFGKMADVLEKIKK